MDSLDTTMAVLGGPTILTARRLLALCFRKSDKGLDIDTFPGPKPDFLIRNVLQFPTSHWRDACAAFKGDRPDVTCVGSRQPTSIQLT
jgi:hypothetical protein